MPNWFIMYIAFIIISISDNRMRTIRTDSITGWYKGKNKKIKLFKSQPEPGIPSNASTWRDSACNFS